MAYARTALIAALARALGGCAATPSQLLDYPPGAFYAPDGKPWRSRNQTPSLSEGGGALSR